MRALTASLLLLLLSGCGEKLDPVRVREAPPPTSEGSDDPCWERDAAPLMRERCLGCHGAGSAHDFSSYESVQAALDQIRFKVQVGQMPPDAPLDSSRKRILLQWIGAEGPRCGP